MNTNKKRNRLILCICSILVLFASIFAVIPFNKETKVVKADTVYDNVYFRGSPVTFTSSMYEYYYSTTGNLSSRYLSGLNSYQVAGNDDYSNYFPFLYTVFTVHMRYDSNGNLQFLPMFQHPVIEDSEGFKSTNGIMDLYYYDFMNRTTATFDDVYYFYSGYILGGIAHGQWLSVGVPTYNGDTGHYIDYTPGTQLLITESFNDYNGGFFNALNQHLSGVIFAYYKSDTTIKIENINKVTFTGDTVKYSDIDGNWISFKIWSSNYKFTESSYYLNNYLFTDNDFYQNGYDYGYDEGFIDGSASASDISYTQGYNAGNSAGYWQGYNQAIENDDRYSFTNLIASVIDVPVQTFTNLFNFEILGVNLSGFFLGLLTCCIVIGIVRLIL